MSTTTKDIIDVPFTLELAEAQPLAHTQDGELDFGSMTDEAIVAIVLQIEAERRTKTAMYLQLEQIGKAEIEKRLRSRGDTSLATSLLEKCELVPEYSDYAVDESAAKAAAEELRARGKDEEAAKIYKVYPERLIPAHVEPARAVVGPQVSVTALINRFGGDAKLGPMLKSIRTRASLGTKFVWKAASR